MSTLRRSISSTTHALRRDASKSILNAGRGTSQLPWTCSSCRLRQRSAQDTISSTTRRLFSSTSKRQETPGSFIPTHQKIPSYDDGQPRTPASTSTALPSHTAKQRSDLSKRLARLSDSILARASIAGQHINTYTGTDFSGIEALRNEIAEQEAEVKTRHVAVGRAKNTHAEMSAKQASSQKEIVGLLERKSSWSPGDLERYMTLVRSEHGDEQAVQKANEELTVAERQLEDTRSLLEKLERKQYHEEQIWSDTIRRNSTWVTIVLMGVNILLLLAQISIFEPYRRRKIVKQIKEALDERTPAPMQLEAVVQEIDAAVQPEAVTHELETPTLEAKQPTLTAEQTSTKLKLDTGRLGSIPPQNLKEYLQYAQDLLQQQFSDRIV